ncbi:hypothetical protein OSTOST_01314 [Ostertagia ostertagi]
MVHRPQSLSSKDGFGCRDRSRSVAPCTHCRSHPHYPSSLRKRTIAAPWCTLSTMSTLRGHKARITIAVGTLSEMLSTIDSSSLTPINTETAPQMQLRTILRRRGVNSAVKRAIENASGLLKVRYDALLSFVRTQENCEELQQEVDRFWDEQQGEKPLEDAQVLITALDAQLLMDDRFNYVGWNCQPLTEMSRSSTIDFWCRFKTAVHDNTNISLSTKFIYLTNSLKGSAALIVQGYDPSKPENYQLAVQALHRRYDRPKFTHNLFHQRLEQLPASSHSASVQRDTLSQIQSFILQLNRYEDTTTSLALMKTILKKFPREPQLAVHKLEHRSGKTWTLPELIDGLNEDIEESERRSWKIAISTSGSQLTTNTVSVNSSRSSTPDPRYTIRPLDVFSLNLCWKCFKPGHPSRTCNRGPCSRCGGEHHYLVCLHAGRRSRPSETSRRRYTRESSDSTSRSHSRGRHHRRTSSHGRRASRSSSRESSHSPHRSYSRTPSPRGETSHRSRTSEHRTVRFRSPIRDESPNNDSPIARNQTQRQESPVYAALDSDEEYEQLMRVYRDTNSPTTLLSTTLDTSTNSSLMTVEALAVNTQANSAVSVTLLLDTGAQRSFVQQDAINKLRIAVSEITPLTTVTFGGIRTTEHLGITHVTLIDKQNKKLQLVLRTKDKITIPCPPNIGLDHLGPFRYKDTSVTTSQRMDILAHLYGYQSNPLGTRFGQFHPGIPTCISPLHRTARDFGLCPKRQCHYVLCSEHCVTTAFRAIPALTIFSGSSYHTVVVMDRRILRETRRPR